MQRFCDEDYQENARALRWRSLKASLARRLERLTKVERVAVRISRDAPTLTPEKMNNYEKIYWLTRLDSLHDAMVFFLISSGAGVITFIFFYPIIVDIMEGKIGNIKVYVKRLAVAFFIVLTVKSFLPTQNEAMLIMAGGATMNYVQSDSSLNKIPYQATEIISKYMDQKISEIEKEKH